LSRTAGVIRRLFIFIPAIVSLDPAQAQAAESRRGGLTNSM
jgi:hypothetical protein